MTFRGTKAGPTVVSYADGYLEWSGFDDDGDEREGTTDSATGSINDTRLNVDASYDDCTYSVQMNRVDASWAGTFRRFDMSGRLETVGRCSGRRLKADGDFVLEGRWHEEGVNYSWRMLLRAVAPAQDAATTNADTRPGPPRALVTLDARTLSKLDELRELIERTSRNRSAKPDVLKALLAVYDTLKSNFSEQKAKRHLKNPFA